MVVLVVVTGMDCGSVGGVATLLSDVGVELVRWWGRTCQAGTSCAARLVYSVFYI